MSALENIEDYGLLRFLTCVSVDDGKITLTVSYTHLDVYKRQA